MKHTVDGAGVSFGSGDWIRGGYGLLHIGHQHRRHNLPTPSDSEGVKIVLSGLARQGKAGAQNLARGPGRHPGERPLAIIPYAGPLHAQRRRCTVRYGETVWSGRFILDSELYGQAGCSVSIDQDIEPFPFTAAVVMFGHDFGTTGLPLDND